MTPTFVSRNEFFTVGGYAFLIWLAAVMTVTPLMVLVVRLVMQHHATLCGVT